MTKKKIPNIYEAHESELDEKRAAYGSASRGEGKAPQIRHTRPEVAKHCARVIVGCNMDYDAAVARMWEEEFPDATEGQIVAMAQTLSESPHIQREIANHLEEIGFGDNAQKKLIGKLWEEVLGKNDKRWSSAARLLAEITGAAKAQAKGETIPTLRIAGIEEGLKTMLGDLPEPSGTIEEDGTESSDD